MEKLLHERLREWAPDGYKSFTGDDMDALADEIERYYIPRPRFEDGEPVQFGDEVEGCDGHVVTMLLFKDGSGTIYGDYDWFWPKESCGRDIDIQYGVNRPQPKVLDADGVEIKVGDTVWDIDIRKKIEIAGVYPSKLHPRVTDTEGWIRNPNELTHKEPDSLEKLRDDMDDWAESDAMGHAQAAAWRDRLSALIERGA